MSRRPLLSSTKEGTLLPISHIADIAESLSLPFGVNSESILLLCQDVEYRLLSLVEDSQQAMRHSKRTVLTVSDVENSLAVAGHAPLFASAAATSQGKNPMKIVQTAQGPVFVSADKEVDFEHALSIPLPPPAPEPSYTSHWVAIEGVQPALTANPQTQSHQTQVKHVLSLELQGYFELLTSTLLSDYPQAALTTLSSDLGVWPLLPYLVQWICEGVVSLLPSNGDMSKYLDAIHALLTHSSEGNVDLYLHRLLPLVLSVLLSPTSTPQRQQAASILSLIITEYGTTYISLHTRVLRTLHTALSEQEAVYGAILGLTACGRAGMSMVLLKQAGLKSIPAVSSDVEKKVVDTLLSLFGAPGRASELTFENEQKLKETLGDRWFGLLQAREEAGAECLVGLCAWF